MRVARLLTTLLKCRLLRRLGVVNGFLLAVVVCVTSLFVMSHYVWNTVASPRTLSEPPLPTISCRVLDNGSAGQRAVRDHRAGNSAERLRTDPRVLVFTETPYTELGQDVVVILESMRLRYRMEVVSTGGGKVVPSLTHADRGRFSVVVFERLESYLGLDSWNRQLLDKYCREYDVGVVAFAQPDEALVYAQVCDNQSSLLLLFL